MIRDAVPNVSGTTTAKVLATLRMLAENRGRLRASDVVRKLGVSKATAYRYLVDLEDAGLVCRFKVGEYVLGPEIASLDRASREFDPYVAAARPVMEALVRDTGATVVLGRARASRVVLIDGVCGPLGPSALVDFRGQTETPLCRALARAHACGFASESFCEVPLPNRRRSRSRAPQLADLRAESGTPSPLAPGAGDAVKKRDRSAMGWFVGLRLAHPHDGALALLVRSDAAPKDGSRFAERATRAALRIEEQLRAAGP